VEKWDGGTYAADGATSAAESERAMRAGLRRGRASFILKGNRLRGMYSLVRLKRPKQWLLIKTHAKK
jgi:bifunctional non-homologous end joining protein LigD